MSASTFEDPRIQNLLERISGEEGFQQPKYSVSAGSKPGDNYCCSIYRAVIVETATEDKGDKRSLSLIFKVSIPRENPEKNAAYRDFNLNEVTAYQTVLPILNKVLKDYGISKSDTFPGTARFFSSYFDDFIQVLVLEDKCTEGYRMLEPHTFLSADHCRLVLEKIALLHAASIVLQRHYPESMETVKKLITKRRHYQVNPVFQDMEESAREGLKLIPDSFKKNNHAYQKMESLIQNYSKAMAAANELPNDISCIIHGDCWFNNALYKYDENDTVVDACMIDYQHCRLASPSLDVTYMLMTSTTKETRDASYDDLIHFYHNKVASLLSKMDCDPDTIIPLENFQEHVKKYGHMAVLVAFSGLSIFLLDSVGKRADSKFLSSDDCLYARREIQPSDPQRAELITTMLTSLVTDAYSKNLINYDADRSLDK